VIALLVPRSHCIAVKEAQGWTMLRADGSQEFRSDIDLECDHTFRDNGDTHVVKVGSLSEAREVLTTAMAEMDALDLLLLSIDPTLSEETRCCCVEELEPLLVEQRVVDSLNSLMSAKPLPATSDIEGAIRLSLKAQRSLTAMYLQRLKLRQPPIARVQQGWDELADDLFESSAERSRFEGACLQAGIFKDFTDAVCHTWGEEPIPT